MVEYTGFLDAVKQRMQSSKFRISHDVALPDGVKAEMVASRTYFSWKGLVIISQHLLVCHVENPTVADLKQLFDTGFAYAKSVNRVPLLRGMQFGYMIIPCIASENVSDQLAQHVAARPTKHWALFECPVVCDLRSGATHYFRETAAWGAFFFSDFRKLVGQYLEGL